MSSDQRLEIGSKLGPYLIVRFIEKGGMGEVYEAQDEFLKRRVALKVIRSNLADDQEVMTRFFSEGQTLAMVSSRYVVQIHTLGQDKGLHYIVMEYVEGLPLSGIIRQKAMGVYEAVPIMLQIIEGVKALHKNLIIHRDLKPRNIIFQTNKEIKILDFGIAKVRDAAGLNITKSGEVLGSVMYMAPEITRGEEASAQSDIWSMGIIFYEILTGRRAITGKNEKEVFHKIRKYKLSFDVREEIIVPVQLRLMIAKMCEQDLSARYKTVSDVLLDLNNYLATVPWAEDIIDSSSRRAALRNSHSQKRTETKKIVATSSVLRKIVTGTMASAFVLAVMWFVSIKSDIQPTSKRREPALENKPSVTNEAPQSASQNTTSTSMDLTESPRQVQGDQQIVDTSTSVPELAPTKIEEIPPIATRKVPTKTVSASQRVTSLSAVEIRSTDQKILLTWRNGRLKNPVKLIWQPVSKAAYYRVEISDDSQFRHIAHTASTSVTSTIWLQARPGQYYWRVRAEKGGLQGPYSSTGNLFFLTSRPELPKNLLVKLDKDARRPAAVGASTRLSWKPSPMVSTYLLQSSRSEAFHVIDWEKEVQGPEAAVSFQPGQNFVRVYPIVRGDRVSASSNTMLVDIVDFRKLESPLVIIPELGAILTVSSTMVTPVVFKWQAIEGVTDGYQVQMATDAEFTAIIYDQKMNEAKLVLDRLLPNGKIFWRVRAQSGSQYSSWSAVSHFIMSVLE